MASESLVAEFVLIPLSSSRQRRALSSRAATLALVRAVLAAVGISVSLSPVQGAAPPAAGEAAALYRRFCQGCHGADGKGARGGAVKDLPDFTQASWHGQRTDVQLVVTILEGKGSGMPSFSERLGEAKAKALVAHLRSFAPDRPKAPAGAPSPAGETDFDARFRQLQNELDELKRQMKELSAAEEDREKARTRRESRQDAGEDPETSPSTVAARFKELCQRCHGADGKGRRGKGGDDVPDFTRRAWHDGRSDAQLLASILDGTDGGMPSFRHRLGETEARELVAHVRGLAGAHPAVPVRSPGRAGDKPPAAVEAREPESPDRPSGTRALQEGRTRSRGLLPLTRG
jgi:mono/diheme cytochrome c family protein